jgi:CRISPR-associated protein Csb2
VKPPIAAVNAVNWLCVEARYLFGKYHGSRDGGRRADYPPSPHRLLQTLTAAANNGQGMSATAKEALHWLEKQSPPQVIVPESWPGSRVTTFVPNNDMNVVARAWAKGREPEKKPESLRTAKILQPRHLGGDATVRFLWPVKDASLPGQCICTIARHIHHLGLGIDLVVGNGRLIEDAERKRLPGITYMPIEGKGWRVPVDGSMEEIMSRYQQQINTMPLNQYDEVAYVREDAGTRRPAMHAFALVSEDGDYCRFDSTDAMVVAAELRHAAHARAKQLRLDAAFTEGYVCGHANGSHDKDDRFAYVPVPTLAPAGRDNDIRRVILLQGRKNSKADSLVRRLSNVSLSGKARLRPIEHPEKDGVLKKYTTAAERWATVTPIVLPGHLSGRGLARRQTKLVLKSLAHAGIMTPVAEIHLQPDAIFPGAERAGRYRVPEYLRHFTKTHARERPAGRFYRSKRVTALWISPPPSKSYKRPAVSHCGPLQRASMSAAFLRLVAASGLLFRWRDCWS